MATFLSSWHMKSTSPGAHVTEARTNVSYQGVVGDGVETFLNIPYGQDTSGAGRFAPPKPFIPARNTVVNATVAGPDCPQQMVPLPGVNSKSFVNRIARQEVL